MISYIIALYDINQETGGKKLGNPRGWKLEESGAPPAGCKYVGNTAAGMGNKENTKPKPMGGERYIAIQTLTPYMNKWTIKGTAVNIPFEVFYSIFRSMYAKR